eukprot:3030329-Rhodomonas_salina.3
MSGTGIAYRPSSLRACYAMSGTDIAYRLQRSSEHVVKIVGKQTRNRCAKSKRIPNQIKSNQIKSNQIKCPKESRIQHRFRHKQRPPRTACTRNKGACVLLRRTPLPGSLRPRCARPGTDTPRIRIGGSPWQC